MSDFYKNRQKWCFKFLLMTAIAGSPEVFFDHLRPLPGPCIKCLSPNFMLNSSAGCLKCCMRIMN